MATPRKKPAPPAPLDDTAPSGTGRRTFLGYLLAAPTLVAAAQLGESPRAHAAQPSGATQPMGDPVPSNPQTADLYDLSDALSDAALPTSNLIKVQVNPDGTVTHEMVRTEVGQGVQTAIAMLIAEEMDLPIEKVNVTQANARPELVWNQLTGGSNSIRSQYYPVRVAAAIAKGQLLEAAAIELDYPVGRLQDKSGTILAPNGKSLSYGELATKAASPQTRQVSTQLKPESEFKIVGKPHRRVNALDIVTGRQQYATDLNIPDALPTMISRPPTINGTPKSLNNADRIKKMPGVTDVALIETGVAVRARTFGQCIDAIHAMDVTWNKGPVEGTSDESVEKELKAATLPMVLPALPGTKTFEKEFFFAFKNNSPLEPSTAIADVKSDSAQIWTSAKIPITTQADVAEKLGMLITQVTVHVVPGGGSFGRRLFNDGALDAAEASQKMGKPVRLMWHRSDEYRQGRGQPIAFSRVRAVHDGTKVLSLEHRHTSERTDWTHGFGDAVRAMYDRHVGVGIALSEAIFELTAVWPYDFGVTKQLLNEIGQSESENHYRGHFNTTAMREVYSPNVVTAQELFVDQLANEMGQDRYEFRRHFAKDEKFRQVIEAVAKAGGWGRPLPPGVAQGIGVHEEYKQHSACLVELDCRPQTVGRKIPGASTGARVTRAVFATTVGRQLVNPLGAEAQLQGGVHDGIALALTSSLHLKDGHFLEASLDDYRYTRHWNSPLDLQVIMLPNDPQSEVGGFGEVGVAPTVAAVACAYGAATGKYPTTLPVGHNEGIPFKVKPFTPASIPESPTDGLENFPAPSAAHEEGTFHPGFGGKW